MNTLSPLAPGSQPKDPAAANIYLTLLDVYLKPQAAINEFDRSIASLAPLRGFVNQRTNVPPRMKGTKKIAQIEEGKTFSSLPAAECCCSCWSLQLCSFHILA